MKMSAKKAVGKLQQLITNMDRAIDEGLEDTASYATSQMQKNLNSYSFESSPDRLKSSIQSEKISDKHYQVSADGGYAVYVEFGSGVVGRDSPHPEAGERGVVYDRFSHGEKGWWYPTSSGGFKHTKGEPSKPFVYKTTNDVKKELPKRVKKRVRQYLKDLDK